MKFTDLFVRRRCWRSCQSGHPHRRLRPSARSAFASSRAATWPTSCDDRAYVGANADLVRGFITAPLERVIAGADGIDFLESSSAQGISTITCISN